MLLSKSKTIGDVLSVVRPRHANPKNCGCCDSPRVVSVVEPVPPWAAISMGLALSLRKVVLRSSGREIISIVSVPKRALFVDNRK
jgi:hypothetical protein